jgi:hypothetical protein
VSLKSNKQKGTLPKREEEEEKNEKNHHSIKARFFLFQFLFHPFKVNLRVNLLNQKDQMPYILISGLLPMISHLLKNSFFAVNSDHFVISIINQSV